MNRQILMTAGFTALFLGTAGSAVYAQDSSQVAYSGDTAEKAAPAAPKKPHKVWTEDDVSSVRTAADNYVDQKQAAADAAAAAAAQEKSVKTEKHKGTPFALTDPKSLAEADKMIAWEERDLEAQQEYVEKVRQQVAEAGPQDRDRLEKYLAQRIAIVEQIKLERANLLKQKKELEKKAAAGANAEAAANTPAQ